MRKLLLFLVLFISTTILFAQDYPEVSIRDIQFVEDDSLLFYGGQNLEPPQPRNGDTVTVTGVVMFPTYQGADVDSNLTISVAAPGIIIQDTEEAAWGGVIVRDLTNSPDFAILEPGLIIKATGIVAAYYTTTQFNLIEFSAENIIGYMEPPAAMPLTLEDFYIAAPNDPNFLAEKWENVIVEFENVTVVEANVLNPGTFSFIDASGRIMNTYNRASRLWAGGDTSPLPGTTIQSIRGFIETWEDSETNTWFMLNPVYPEDIVRGTVSPPSIDNVERSNLYAGYGEEIIITADINDLDGTSDVAETKLYYTTGRNFTEVDMELVDAETGSYSATIPAVNDSSIVKYYLWSVDEAGIESSSPSAADVNPYWYYVLDRELKIQDVQYIPEWSNFTALNNMEVTVTGVVTADTSDMPGGVYYAPTVFIQDGAGPWDGIIIFGTEAYTLSNGDKVSVTGVVNENNGLTYIGNIEKGVSVVTLETGVALPEPQLISTSIVTNPALAESYESVLVKMVNIKVTDENEDGDPGPGGVGNANYGEATIADDSGIDINFLLDCGSHNYHNFWDPSQEGQPIRILTGDTFEELRGIFFYSYSQYKLNPRKNDDFIGHVTGVEEEISNTADSYALSQNYPNPFNPSTKIQFSMPEAGHVKLNVYNILGQKIVNLVDEFKNVGSYSVNFDASNLTSGIYFYEITVNNYSQLKKMMLLK